MAFGLSQAGSCHMAQGLLIRRLAALRPGNGAVVRFETEPGTSPGINMKNGDP
jgi:hypothetical protein